MSVSSSLGRRLDPDDQVRLPALGCEEGIDPAGLANQGDIGLYPGCNGFQEGHIRRAGQMPVLGIPDNEIEDRFVLRQNDDGGMTHLRLNIDQLIDTGNCLDAKHGALRGVRANHEEQADPRERQGETRKSCLEGLHALSPLGIRSFAVTARKSGRKEPRGPCARRYHLSASGKFCATPFPNS